MSSAEAMFDEFAPVTFGDRIRQFLSPYLPFILVSSLLIAFTVVFFFHRIVITIYSGEAGVMYRRFGGGTEVDTVYQEGLHLIFPWDRLEVYNVRNQIIPHEFTALTNTGLPIKLNVSIRFHPEYNLLGYLHQNIGPDYVNVAVIPVVEATIRSAVGQYTAEQVYTTKRAVVQHIINEAIERAARKYIIIDDVLVTSVTLPEVIQKAIERKLEEEQKYQAYTYIKQRESEEATRKKIEAEGIREYQRIIGETLSPNILLERGIRATEQLAQSSNSKVVVIGSGKDGLPIILGNEK